MSDQEKREIKAIFKGYRRMTTDLRLTLESYDLIICDSSTHYKIRRRDQVGGMCILSKTSSDYRAGANFCHYIIRMLEA